MEELKLTIYQIERLFSMRKRVLKDVLSLMSLVIILEAVVNIISGLCSYNNWSNYRRVCKLSFAGKCN